VLYLFAPHLALALLALAIFLLYQKRVAASCRTSARVQSAPRRLVAWKDPWSTEGLEAVGRTNADREEADPEHANFL